MIKASINNLIGVSVDESYPWVDTLFIKSGVATFNIEDYEKCKAYVSIEKKNSINTSDCRDIGDGMFISNSFFVDIKYGVRIEKKGPNQISLIVTQECNEWLIICVQLLLLQLDCTLIHGAALEKNGEVILLPSWGGVGKTATVMHMVSDNCWRLLGDDLVVIRKDKVLPFLKPFVIYPYHKNLFPEIFERNKRRVVTNIKLSNLLSKMIPTVKRVLRHTPGLLAFARKHNPQSTRVSPRDIFKNEQLSTGGVLKKIVWLERTVDGNIISFSEKNVETIVSKTISVSIIEIFADRLPCVFALCGAGIFDYKNIYLKMYNIIESAYKNNLCYELDIPTSVSIEQVGDLVLKNISNL